MKKRNKKKDCSYCSNNDNYVCYMNCDCVQQKWYKFDLKRFVIAQFRWLKTEIIYWCNRYFDKDWWKNTL